ncbi:riboflavin aldehydeforming enzyme [Mucor ambiguus]|uniref:Riboflavin aldehydeforming enzyme n=1 Tax=Mucor ambiguus TaxID=91626 RepID=A0A0C9MJZ0_9FUNG|nr:riboflavin aldehydeforming enzyme [Mucor ambiguus]
MQLLSSTIISMLVASALLMPSQAAPTLQTRSSMTGDATFYSVGSGSCGGSNSDNELVAAISGELMGSGSKKSSHCGKYITVKGKHGSVKLKIVDTCPGCKKGDVDMSRAAFEKIAKLSEGRVPISWSI